MGQYILFLVLITYSLKLPLNTHVGISSRAGGLHFDMSLDLHPCFMYPSSRNSENLLIWHSWLLLSGKQTLYTLCLKLPSVLEHFLCG